MKIISANIGFVTNSSSVVYHFPKEVMDNEDIQAFIKAFEIDEGYVGDNMWSRNACQSFLVTKEQKRLAREDFHSFDSDYISSCPSIEDDENQVVLIYGDEYNDITSMLLSMMRDVAKKMDVGVSTQDYN